MQRLHTHRSGFTLPELLVALLLCSILVIVGFIVLKPQSYEVQERNAGRWVDLAFIVRTVDKYYAAKGVLPADIPAEAAVIGTESENYNLCKDLVPAYAKDMPFDPQYGLKTDASAACDAKGQRYVSSYMVSRSSDGKSLTVAAPFAENDEQISITKTYQ